MYPKSVCLGKIGSANLTLSAYRNLPSRKRKDTIISFLKGILRIALHKFGKAKFTVVMIVIWVG
jgi:hypothetical protein